MFFNIGDKDPLFRLIWLSLFRLVTCFWILFRYQVINYTSLNGEGFTSINSAGDSSIFDLDIIFWGSSYLSSLLNPLILKFGSGGRTNVRFEYFFGFTLLLKYTFFIFPTVGREFRDANHFCLFDLKCANVLSMLLYSGLLKYYPMRLPRNRILETWVIWKLKRDIFL